MFQEQTPLTAKKMRIGIIIIMLLMVSNITKAQNKEGINNSKLKKQITQELNKVDFEIPDYMKKEIDAIGGLDQFYFDAITLF